MYDTRRADNEAESAKFAMQVLAGAAAEERLEFIAAMIRASAKHGIPDSMQGGGCKGLRAVPGYGSAILGSPAAEFDVYERAVRLEYGWVPEEAMGSRADSGVAELPCPSIYLCHAAISEEP